MGVNLTTDKELVIQLIGGDEDAFREIYYRYKGKVWAFCFSFLKSKDDVDDIVQEVFLRLWENRAFLDPERSFSSYLFVMSRNRVRNWFRDIDIDAQAKKCLQLQGEVSDELPHSQLLDEEYRRLLSEAIELLSPRRKVVFNLSRIEEKSHREIAKILDISVNTVQEHISESLRFIKHYISQRTDLFR